MDLHVKHAAIQVDALMLAGYWRYVDPLEQARMGVSYIESFQKWMEDERGKKYALHFTHVRLRYPDRGVDLESMSASAQFRRGETVFNVAMLNHEETLAETEAFFEEMWQAMKLDFYERR